MDICLFFAFTIIAFIKVCCGTWYKASHFYRFLCKEKVREEKFEAHISTCAQENEWYIHQLPKSEVRKAVNNINKNFNLGNKHS